MNTPQKIGLLLCSALSGLAVIFHSPWDGYAYYEDLFSALAKDPVFYWFGNIVHLHVAITFLFVCYGIFFYMFRTPTNRHTAGDDDSKVN